MRILFLVLILVSFTSFAYCYGTGAFKHCDDLDSGNSYDIYKYGNLQRQMDTIQEPVHHGTKLPQHMEILHI